MNEVVDDIKLKRHKKSLSFKVKYLKLLVKIQVQQKLHQHNLNFYNMKKTEFRRPFLTIYEYAGPTS